MGSLYALLSFSNTFQHDDSLFILRLTALGIGFNIDQEVLGINIDVDKYVIALAKLFVEFSSFSLYIYIYIYIY